MQGRCGASASRRRWILPSAPTKTASPAARSWIPEYPATSSTTLSEATANQAPSWVSFVPNTIGLMPWGSRKARMPTSGSTATTEYAPLTCSYTAPTAAKTSSAVTSSPRSTRIDSACTKT